MRKTFYDRYANLDRSTPGHIDLAWPSKGQRLLCLPDSSTPREVVADIDWLLTFDDELMMADAYKDSADLLVEALRSGGDGTHPDRFAFPIIYLYRHAVELRLKEIIRLGVRRRILDDPDAGNSVLGTHRLDSLWSHSRRILEKVWPDGDRTELEAVEAMIYELHETDPDGQHLRYSHSKDGVPNTHSLPRRADLLHLRSVFAGLWSLISSSVDGILDRTSEEGIVFV